MPPAEAGRGSGHHRCWCPGVAEQWRRSMRFSEMFGERNWISEGGYWLCRWKWYKCVWWEKCIGALKMLAWYSIFMRSVRIPRPNLQERSWRGWDLKYRGIYNELWNQFECKVSSHIHLSQETATTMLIVPNHSKHPVTDSASFCDLPYGELSRSVYFPVSHGLEACSMCYICGSVLADDKELQYILLPPNKFQFYFISQDCHVSNPICRRGWEKWLSLLKHVTNTDNIYVGLGRKARLGTV